MPDREGSVTGKLVLTTSRPARRDSRLTRKMLKSSSALWLKTTSQTLIRVASTSLLEKVVRTSTRVIRGVWGRVSFYIWMWILSGTLLKLVNVSTSTASIGCFLLEVLTKMVLSGDESGGVAIAEDPCGIVKLDQQACDRITFGF
jgi:hypothetical protein